MIKIGPWSLATAFLLACGRPPLKLPRPSTSPTAEVSPIGPPAGAALLQHTARIATGAHAGPLQIVAAGARRAGESLDGFVFVPAKRCALVYGRSGESVVDLDLHAFADDGTQFGADEASDDLPTLMLCAAEKGERLFLSARVAQGQGLIALGMHDVPFERREQVVQAVGAGNRNSKFEPNTTVWPALDASLSEHRQTLGSSWTDLRRVALPVDARLPTSVDAEIPANRCLDILALPDDPYLQLDLSVLTEDGRIVSRGQNHGDERYTLVCSRRNRTRVHVELRPQSGQGLVLLALSLSELGGARQLKSSSGITPVVLHESPSIDPPASVPLRQKRQLRLASGQLHRLPLRLRGCDLLSLHSPSPQTFHLRLWHATGNHIASTPESGGSALIACAHGEAELELEASRTDDVELRIYGLPESPLFKDIDRRIVNQALNYLVEDLPLHQLTRPSRVSTLKLSEHRLSPLQVEIPASTCTSLAIASGADTGSIDLRLTEEKTQSPALRARGSTVSTLSACNPTTRPVRRTFEIRRTGREVEALVLEYEQPIAPAPSDG